MPNRPGYLNITILLTMAEANSSTTKGLDDCLALVPARVHLTKAQNKRVNDAIEPLELNAQVKSELLYERSQLRQEILHGLMVSKLAPTACAGGLVPPCIAGMAEVMEFGMAVATMAKALPTKDDVWDNIVATWHSNMPDQFFDADVVAREFQKNLAEWSRSPDDELMRFSLESKGDTYTAITGASGSGKSCTLIWLGNKWVVDVTKIENILRIYLTCAPKEHQTPTEYAETQIKKIIAECGQGYDAEDLKPHCRKTVLSLMMDEVPSRWKHDDYLEVARKIREGLSFKQVFVMVAGTALNFDVTSQPTTSGQIFKMRLLPLGDNKMVNALEYHLDKDTLPSKEKRKSHGLDTKALATRLMAEMPLLKNLLTNQRCARLSGETLLKLLRKMEEVPAGWCRGHAAVLLSMVSSSYRYLNGLRDMKAAKIRKLMLQGLALTTLQKQYDGKQEGVKKNPGYLRSTKELVEAGLVERTMIPEDAVPGKDGEFKVDNGYEWSMSPAVTLLCVSTVVPWVSGVHNASDHFELLVATMMVAIRFGQTGVEFPVVQLEKGVPYSKNDGHFFYYPKQTENICLVNGPQAAYSDLMIARAVTGVEHADEMTEHLKRLASSVDTDCILVQCKATDSANASIDVDNEYNKIGFVMDKDGKRSSPLKEGKKIESKDEKDEKKYRSGRWLTKKSFGGDDVCVWFATNQFFEKTALIAKRSKETFIEGGGRENCYAWQCLYPFNQLVRPPGTFSPVYMDRLKGEFPGLKREAEHGKNASTKRSLQKT